MKKLGVALAVLLVIGAPAYWWLFVSAEDAQGKWPVDLEQLRAAAKSMEGPRPTEVHVEKIAVFAFPSTAQVAGTGWSSREMVCFAYQAVFADGHTVVIDTAMDEATAKSELPLQEYDGAAWKRLQDALSAAQFSVATHEHYDHIGGMLLNPTAWEKALVNPAQLEHPELVKPLKYPGAKPKTVLEYDGVKAVAPGIVLVRTPGHTPGSQLVYVLKEDGGEVLFLGDVAWTMENVDRVRERARAVTALMSENRGNVLQQLAAVKAMKDAEPKLSVVAGHDGAVVEGLISSGVLKRQFAIPSPP